MPKKLTYEFVKKSFESEGYTLLSKEYKDAHSKLKCACNKGHIFFMTWGKFSSGRRCKYCNGNDIWFGDVITSFNEEGYQLLTKEKEYINTKSKLKCTCPGGHYYEVSLSHWKKGSRCKKCYVKSLRIPLDVVKEDITSEGYTILSILDETTFTASTRFEVKCTAGHVYSTTWNVWRRNHRCKLCSNKIRFEKLRLSISYIKESIESDNYKLLSTNYINAFSKIKVKCQLGHVYSATWRDWQQGCRCPICANIKRSVVFRGSNHPNWKGGISFEPYPLYWTKELRDSIKERDGYKCLNPDCRRNDKVLSVHHINFNKNNCHPSNLITVCRSCNTRANYEREWHKPWYQAIMNKRYNYKY